MLGAGRMCDTVSLSNHLEICRTYRMAPVSVLWFDSRQSPERGLCMPVAPITTKYETRLGVATERQLERFRSKYEIADNGCAIWQGMKSDNGYGLFYERKNKRIRAHRFSWLAWRGDLIDGMVIDHICRTILCVSTQHLQQVTPLQNAIMGLSG